MHGYICIFIYMQGEGRDCYGYEESTAKKRTIECTAGLVNVVILRALSGRAHYTCVVAGKARVDKDSRTYPC